MSWLDDYLDEPAGPKYQQLDVNETGPGSADNPSWRWHANDVYSGGERYSPEYDIIFYPVHTGGNSDPFARVLNRSGESQSHELRFRCWLTKFQDNFTSEWNSEHVYGRMDPIETFKATKRVINFGFDVMASTPYEAKANQRMISALIRGLYPTYQEEPIKVGTWSSSVGIIQAPPVWKIKLSNLIQDTSKEFAISARDQGLLGRIAGISYVPNLDEGIFPGHLLNEEGKMYPQACSLDIAFHVWHTVNPGYTVTHSPRKGFGNFPYIGTDDADSTITAGGGSVTDQDSLQLADADGSGSADESSETGGDPTSEVADSVADADDASALT